MAKVQISDCLINSRRGLDSVSLVTQTAKEGGLHSLLLAHGV